MLTFYCLRACIKCDEFSNEAYGFRRGVAEAEKAGRPWRIVALDTTERLQDYNHRVKPTLPPGMSVPLWYDESARQVWKNLWKTGEKVAKSERIGAKKRAK